MSSVSVRLLNAGQLSPLEHSQMERDPNRLDYATPRRQPSVAMASLVRGLGSVLLVGGSIWALLGTAGLDNRTTIFTGCVIAAVGLVVAVLGQILHAVETRR